MAKEGISATRVNDDRIETERLILRPPVYSDAPGLHALLSERDVCRYSPYPPFENVADVHFAIADWREARQQELRTYVGAHRSDPQTPIGFVQVGPDEELGGSLLPNQTGQGLAVEALQAMIHKLELKNAWTIIDAEHEALIQTLAKVNIVKEKTLPAHRIHPQISADKRDCVLLRQQSN